MEQQRKETRETLDDLDFHNQLLRQPKSETKDVALAIELFTEGSLNTFAKPTNVDIAARILHHQRRRRAWPHQVRQRHLPFVNSFPKNTHLYRLMSTKFSENRAA